MLSNLGLVAKLQVPFIRLFYIERIFKSYVNHDFKKISALLKRSRNFYSLIGSIIPLSSIDIAATMTSNVSSLNPIATKIGFAAFIVVTEQAREVDKNKAICKMDQIYMIKLKRRNLFFV